jgi:putative transposase
LRDEELGPVIKDLWQKNYSVYGRRKLTKAARRKNLECGRDQVARLMKQQGIQGASRAKKRFTTHADASHLRAPDLVKRQFVATRPNQLWVADFERHEALLNREGVQDPLRQPVAAGW